MLDALPGVFCAGEMLDWEAPTGGYLLTACFASGLRAGRGAVAWLGASTTTPVVRKQSTRKTAARVVLPWSRRGAAEHCVQSWVIRGRLAARRPPARATPRNTAVSRSTR